MKLDPLKYVFIFMQEMSWKSPPQPSHTLAKIFIKVMPIIWINTEERIREVFVCKEIKQIFNNAIMVIKGLFFCRKAYCVSDFLNPILLNLPFTNHIRLIWEMNIVFNRFQLAIYNIIIKRNYRDSKCVLWIYSPQDYLLSRALKHDILVYHILDDRRAKYAWQLGLRKTIAIENEIFKKADIIFACNEKIVERAKEFNQNTFVQKNGVNFSDYQRLRDERENPPTQLSRLKRPIIGFVGTVDSRNDYELLAKVASIRPDWSFVLLGLITSKKATNILSMENVHFIGLVNNNEIPNYIINYDVCINFPIITQLTEHADYLKLYEYLAAGKPVVSTNVYAARKIKQLVKIATDSQDFIYKIESSLTDRNEKIINDRLRFARENSWKNRAEDMMNIIKKVS